MAVVSTDRVVRHGPIDRELLVRFATLLNDFNPVHYDDEFAVEMGLPGVVAPGTLTYGWVLADIEPMIAGVPLPVPKPHTLSELELRLRAPVFVGECIEITYRTVGDGEIKFEAVAGKPPTEAKTWRKVSDGSARWTAKG